MPEDRLADPIVLIVEDDPMLAEEMSIALRRHGLAAIVAPDWETAIQHVASTPLDLIVLDQRLGSVDAVLRLPALRVLTRVPVLVLTANQAEADRILALETGADDFLLKPISGRELVARVRAHLRRIAPPPAPPSPSRPQWRFSLSERRLTRPNGEAAAGALALVNSHLSNDGIAVRTSLPQDLPPVLGRLVLLENVLVNLCVNARDAMRGLDADKRILRIEAVELPRGRVELRVTDQGGGIPAHVMPRLFEPFFTTKPPGEGTGLGLSVSHGMMQAMDGGISVTNTGTGACFVLNPRVAAALEPVHPDE